MNKSHISKIFEILQKLNPNPTTELIYNSNFELLVSVILSAQATDISVNKATKELFKIANTPEAIFNLGEDGLIKYIKSIGLYRTKAFNIIKTCKMLMEQHDSHVPDQRNKLEALPGVGRKTANVVLNTAFGYPTIAVDTHIFRLANRIGIAPGKTVLAVEKKLNKVIPKQFMLHAHHWLILHGRYICIARKPKCSECKIKEFCKHASHDLKTALSSSKKQQ
ncbi:MAG: endonuclease III [Thiotrichales bacterium]|nr:MAG: endonuclease III [Thiotrichales bacterium]